jgi:hypothetical protein
LDFFTGRKSDHASFRPAADRTAYVKLGGKAASAGENKKSDGLQLLFNGVDNVLEGNGMPVFDPLNAGVFRIDRCGEVRAQYEQIALNGLEAGPHLFVPIPRERQANSGIQFIDRAVRFDAL